jgi:hypothetical protein
MSEFIELRYDVRAPQPERGFSMPSPFPGMNPYLERSVVWPDFHQAYLTHLRDTLEDRLGSDYFVGIGERVYLHESEDDRRLIGIPDANLILGVETKTTAIMVAPSKVTIPKLQKRKVPYLEVVDADNQEGRDRDRTPQSVEQVCGR